MIRTIDAHAAGGPLRLIVEGFPSPHGRMMAEKRDWLTRHADHWRRALLLEPRGHADMCGAILTEPVSPGLTRACCSCVSLIGTRFTGRVVARTTVGEYAAIVPEIEGAAWITGDHTFQIDDDDPLKEGFRI